MSILVTGAGGFIGLNLVERLLGDGHSVVALGNRPMSAIAKAAFAGLPGTLTEVTADVRRAEDLRAAVHDHGVRQIFHGAAITLGPTPFIAPASDVMDINLVSTATLLGIAREAGVARFVYPSSVTVHAGSSFGEAPLTEDTPPTPATLYGFTKLACERLMHDAAARHGVPIAIGRITAAFGPWEHDTGARELLSPPFQIARKALSGEPITLATGGWRDWTSARDVARAFALLLTADSLPRTTYNLSLGQIWNPALLCEALAARLPGVTYTTSGPTNLSYNDDLTRIRQPMTNTLIAADLGFHFQSPQEAAAEYADWLDALGAEPFAALNAGG
ncbi:NAD-dependent epimerase/dehydratase family protein [Acuticoccus yangtzensis]|uniref:NAD-dependent epimerase/dehydratase family protein n=1 Tax=Acuticoccus yangtzensis TaxID=1443441 RepID=UPI0009497D98|nr:NAD(P)-dependent oxidoreductase [Acuticoccus yangtzensis]